MSSVLDVPNGAELRTVGGSGIASTREVSSGCCRCEEDGGKGEGVGRVDSREVAVETCRCRRGRNEVIYEGERMPPVPITMSACVVVWWCGVGGG